MIRSILKKIEEIDSSPFEIKGDYFGNEIETYKLHKKEYKCGNSSICEFKFSRVIDGKEVYTYVKSKFPLKVMTTIQNLILELIENNDIVVFTAFNKEPKRVKRYYEFIQKNLPYNYNLFTKEIDNNTLFIVYKDKEYKLDCKEVDELEFLKEL